MSVFKSKAGRDLIHQTARSIYESDPVASDRSILQSEEFGETHLIRTGPKNAPPLILLHGTSSNSASWFGYIPEWSERFRIYALDLPGQPGLSDDRRPLISDGGMRRWLRSCVEQIGLKKFHIVGMSLGGTTALSYASQWPESISSMTLLTSGGLAHPRLSFVFRALPLFFLGDHGARCINRIAHGSAPVDPETEAFAILAARHFRPFAENFPLFTDEELGKIHFPLLYIAGRDDALLNTTKSARRLKEAVPEAEILIIENLGHVVLDQGAVIAEFISPVRSPSSLPSLPPDQPLTGR